MKNLRRSVLWLAVAGAMTLSAAVPVRAIFGKEEAPCAVAAFAKSDGEGQLITFTKEDFTDRVTGEESLSAIVMGDLPSGGVLRLAGADVRSGEAVEVSRLGALCFVPDIGREVHTSFSFLPVFDPSGMFTVMRLPSGFTATLPPTEESTCASREVGTCIKGMPRM